MVEPGPATEGQFQPQLQLQAGNTNQLIPKLLPLPLHALIPTN